MFNQEKREKQAVLSFALSSLFGRKGTRLFLSDVDFLQNEIDVRKLRRAGADVR